MFNNSIFENEINKLKKNPAFDSSNEAETFNKINDLIQQSSQQLLCGPSCQKERKIQELKQTYMNAESNNESASTTLASAKKNYYTYAKGIDGYNEMMETELKDKATKIANVMFENFIRSIKKTSEMIDIYSNSFNNKIYIQELLDEYIKKNNDLKKQINNTKSTIFTEDRKTYYEKQNFGSLQSWYNIFKWIYIFCVFVLLITCFIKKYSWFKIILIFLIFCIYPFIIRFLILLFVYITKKITEMIPKNIYLTNGNK